MAAAPTLTPTQAANASALGLTVREVGHMRAVVACPYCGGERVVNPASFRDWVKSGRVPSCATVKRMNRGTECRDVPAGRDQ